MDEILLLSKSFALDADSERIRLEDFLRAIPYFELAGGTNYLRPFKALHAWDERPAQPDLDVEDLIHQASRAPKLPLDDALKTFVRKFKAAGVNAQLKKMEAVQLPIALGKARKLHALLSRHLLGQPAVVDALARYVAGRNAPNHGLSGVYIFAGPAGSGKSLAARLLCESLGADYQLWNFDCSAVDSPIERCAFDGTRSAFQGSRPGELTSFIREHPNSVIVLDHFSRMVPTVQSFLMPLLETGFLTDQFGFYEDNDKNRKQIAPPVVDFRNCHLVISVETGSELVDAPALLGRLENQGGEQAVLSALTQALKKARNELSQPPGPVFAAPVLSRLLSDGVVCLFRRLDFTALSAIARNSILAAQRAFESRFRAHVYLDGFEELATLLVLEQGGQVDTRQLGEHTVFERLFGPLIQRVLTDSAEWTEEVMVVVDDVTRLRLATIQDELGDAPMRALLRGMQRLTFGLDVETQATTLTIHPRHPRLTKIVSADDFGGPAGIQVEAPTVTFADVAGMADVKQLLKRQAEHLKNAARLANRGIQPAGGALLTGAPGVGKTLLAKAFANEAGLPFISVTGPQLLDIGFQREVFKKLRAFSPAALFVDEIDGMGGRQNGTNPAVNELLSQLDGMASQTGMPIFVIATSNHPDRIDKALLRPGRIEFRVEVDAPDREARALMLSKVAPRLELNVLPRLLDYSAGMSGAQLSAATREMLLSDGRLDEHAARAALDEVVFGLPEILSPQLRETIAWHEAGHAVAELASGTNHVEYISLTARQRNAGHVLTSRKENAPLTAREARSMLAVFMAGRVAQKLRFGEGAGADTGDADDLEKATRLAWKAIAIGGLDPELGPVHLPATDSDMPMPALARRVERRVHAWLVEAEAQAFTLLKRNWPAVEAVAMALLDRGAIAHDELNQIVRQSAPERFAPVCE